MFKILKHINANAVVVGKMKVSVPFGNGPGRNLNVLLKWGKPVGPKFNGKGCRFDTWLNGKITSIKVLSHGVLRSIKQRMCQCLSKFSPINIVIVI